MVPTVSCGAQKAARGVLMVKEPQFPYPMLRLGCPYGATLIWTGSVSTNFTTLMQPEVREQMYLYFEKASVTTLSPNLRMQLMPPWHCCVGFEKLARTKLFVLNITCITDVKPICVGYIASESLNHRMCLYCQYSINSGLSQVLLPLFEQFNSILGSLTCNHVYRYSRS